MRDRIFELTDIVRETGYATHCYHGPGHLEKIYENALVHHQPERDGPPPLFALLFAILCVFFGYSSSLIAAGSVTPALGLPVFRHQGVVLDYEDLRYNPSDDIIYPSVIEAHQYFARPLGRYYLYYAPHNAPGGIRLAYADALPGPWREYAANPVITREWPPHYQVSHVSGPDAIWSAEEKRLLFYFHGENSVTRLASSTDGIHFDYEGSKLYMFVNIGPRLHNKIALAVADVPATQLKVRDGKLACDQDRSFRLSPREQGSSP